MITQLATGTLHNPSADYLGQSFATPSSGGPWDNITFSFIANGTPYAIGKAFLLMQPLPNGVYPETTSILPSMLNASVSGFVAEANATSNGQYVFDPTITLQPGVTYYVYENALIPAETVSGGSVLTGPGNCCVSYYASASSGYIPPPDGGSANFVLTGTPVTVNATPAPSTLILVLAGLVLLLALLTRSGVVRWSRT